MKAFYNKKPLLFLLFLAMIVSLALCCSACGAKARENGGGEIRFTDALGREVAVSQNTERVASLLGSWPWRRLPRQNRGRQTAKAPGSESERRQDLQPLPIPA